MKKKILAFLLALSMVFSTAMPVAAEGEFATAVQNVEAQVEEPAPEVQDAEVTNDNSAEEAATVEPAENVPAQQEEEISNANGVLTYTVNEDGTSCTITDCDESVSGALEIPGEIDGYKVTKIGAYS